MSVDPFSFAARAGSGDCRIPEVFGDAYRRLSASLDWARAYAARPDPMAPHYAAIELEAAADAAEMLARQCRVLARQARERETS